MKRVRLLIYDGPQEWIRMTRIRDFVQEGLMRFDSDTSITDIEVRSVWDFVKAAWMVVLPGKGKSE